MCAKSATAIEDSAFMRHLSAGSLYSIFVEEYGLLVERLFKKIERMHQTGSSGIRQSVFAHVENGLLLICELREQLAKHLRESIRWQDVELMWIFHDIGEIGLDSDIPSYRKTKLDRLNEEKKAIRILSSINHRQLRTTLLGLHARCAQRSSNGTDREAAICAFVDKLEAAIFIGASGIGEVWKKRVGRWVFQRIVRKNALGAFIGPASNLSRFLDPDGRAYLCDRIASVVASYFERGLISKPFFEDRMAAIEIALQSAHHQRRVDSKFAGTFQTPAPTSVAAPHTAL